MKSSQFFILFLGIVIGYLLSSLIKSNNRNSKFSEEHYAVYKEIIRLILDASNELDNISKNFMSIDKAAYNEALSKVNRFTMDNLPFIPNEMLQIIQVITDNQQSRESLLDAYIAIVSISRKELGIKYRF